MKKLISKLKEVPDLESKHPWSSISQNYNSNINENINSFNHSSSANYQSPNFSHLNSFIGKKFNVGRFSVVIEEIIAEGGFGIVFKVKSQDDHVFALKRLCVNNRLDLKVCKREITIMSSLTHKNILSLIDSQINEPEGGIYEVLMLLAYCPKNVVQLMQSKQKMQQHLSENVIIKILCDIIEAVARLHYCHTPVIHRDLKVENILIDERNNYVLCDFGSATARQIIPSEFGMAKTEEEISKYTTLAYRSPEMVQLGSQIINCKSDIWALGCLLYYLCYFTLPFGDRILAIQSGNFSIPKVDVVYSEKILKLIQYMLTVDPVERPSIYQVSVLAFAIANKKCPIQNLDKEKVPQWSDLPLPNSVHSPKKAVSDTKPNQSVTLPRDGDAPKTSVTSNSASRSKSVVNQSRTISTSINPRNRPRAHKQPIGKSDSNDNFSDKPVEHQTASISQSNSFNISLSNSKTTLPKVRSATLNHSHTAPHETQNPSIILNKSVEEPNTQDDHPPQSESTSEKTNELKTRYGHRRMVSETSSKTLVEENIKSGTSLLELARKGSIEQDNESLKPIVPKFQNTHPVSIKVSDEVENDASFGEEFDKIRHFSGASGGD